jgi:hypothetical protein
VNDKAILALERFYLENFKVLMEAIDAVVRILTQLPHFHDLPTGKGADISGFFGCQENVVLKAGSRPNERPLGLLDDRRFGVVSSATSLR